MTVLLEAPDLHFVCPNCTQTAVIKHPNVPLDGSFQHMHHCSGLLGMFAPMVLEGVRCKVEAVERADFVNDERGLRYDGEGRPISFVVTTRDDGIDACAYPAVAYPRSVA